MTIDRWVAFDTETTGLDGNARIIEIACVLFEKGEIVKKFETFMAPKDVDWESPGVQSALAVNKIDLKELQGKPEFHEVFHHLYIAFNEAPVWVAHNAEFDIRMLNQEYRRFKGGEFPIKPAQLCICTKLLSSSIHPGEKSHKLQDTAPRWGVVPDGAHRAASDAITCGRILGAMTKGHLPEDISQVHELQKQASSSWGGRRAR